MSGNSNFPTALDDNTSLHDVVDGSTAIVAAHHNDIKEAVKAIESKLGIYNTSAPTSLDYRIGNPTDSHFHNGASGQGRLISPSTFGGLRYPVQLFANGSLAVGSKIAAPVILGRTMQLESVQAGLRIGPSGATTAIDVNIGPTSIFQASQLFRPIFSPGATSYVSNQSPNLVTYPSGAMITLDADAVGSNTPGQDLSITLIFRD